MIAKITIDNVFETARVEEVIGDFVQLKKSGSNFKGLSPFTDERSPSFMVSPVKQIWKDFSSGKGGNVVAFLMEHEHFTYPEAIKYLARKYGIEIEETEKSDEEKEQADERESMYLVSDFAKKYFHETLLNSEEGKAIGLTYFKERGFSNDTIQKFQLGYSPNSWDAFTLEALKNGYKLEYLEKTGLTIVKEVSATSAQEKHFDRFKGRVMFPILSMSGRTLGFGGRILTSDKKAAKYLNSPESDIYHKSKVLYGIFHAKQAIAKEDNCFLVEGYTDVIQFAQTGIHNVVSSSGTALTSEQIRLVNRLTKNITLLFDGDAAGLRASLRGVDLILEQGMNVKICTFPEGEDPDSFARKKSLEELILYLEENAQDFINFKASILIKETKNDPVKKADTIRDMVSSISKIPDVIKREIYIQECSRIMDISEDVLFNALAQLLSKNLKEASKAVKQNEEVFEVINNRAQPAEKIDVQKEIENKIMEILFLYGDKEAVFKETFLKFDENGKEIPLVEEKSIKVFQKLYLDLQEDEMEFANPTFQELFTEVINHFQTDDAFEINAYTKRLEDEKARIVTDIFMEDGKYRLDDWERKDVYVKQKNDSISQLLMETVLSLRNYLISSKINNLSQGINEMEEMEQAEIIRLIMDYQRLRTKLSNELQTVVRRF